MRTPRWLLFALAMSSLVLLTYAGVLLAFSVPIDDTLAAQDPVLTAGDRAVVVPVSDAGAVATRAANASEPALLMRGTTTSGSLPNAAEGLRAGRALLHVPAGSNGTHEIDNVTLDLAALSGGAEGWILRAADGQPFFVPSDDLLGTVARIETTARIGGFFLLGGVGFVLPLVIVVLTHRATRGARRGAPFVVCRECRAPMQAGAEFCMRCGAWSKGEVKA